MDIMIFTGVLLLGGLINFIKEVDTKTVIRLAGIYIFFAWVSVVYTWIFYFVGVNDADMQKVLSVFLQIISLILYGTLGYLAGYITLNFQEMTGKAESEALQRIIRKTLLAVSIAVANTFLVVTLGKSLYQPFMVTFFRQSCYAAWFVYLIMIAEPLSSLGILFHFRLKTGPLATACLMLLMLGAVYTHWHNKDPFPDYYAAVMEFITLSLLQALYYIERQAFSKRKIPVNVTANK